jgi:hypothetical protein
MSFFKKVYKIITFDSPEQFFSHLDTLSFWNMIRLVQFTSGPRVSENASYSRKWGPGLCKNPEENEENGV